MSVQAFFATILLAAVVAFAPSFAPGWLAQKARLTAHGTTEADSRCNDADRAAVAQLLPLMGRTTEADGYVVDRALHALDIARTHCRYGWVETGLGNYAWLERWIEANN